MQGHSGRRTLTIALCKTKSSAFSSSSHYLDPFCSIAVLSHSVVSDSLWPHGLQPTRLLCPWGFSTQEYWSGLLPGASMGDPTHGKGHEEETWRAKMRSGLKGPPWTLSSIYPKTRICFTISCLSPTPLMLTGGCPRPPFSKACEQCPLI